VDSQSSFAFDHATGKASAVQSYVVESKHEDLMYVTFSDHLKTYNIALDAVYSSKCS
jgi:hypothetical protein